MATNTLPRISQDSLEQDSALCRSLPNPQLRRLQRELTSFVEPFIVEYKEAVKDYPDSATQIVDLAFRIEKFAQPLAVLYLEMKARGFKGLRVSECLGMSITIAGYAESLRQAADEDFLKRCGISS